MAKPELMCQFEFLSYMIREPSDAPNYLRCPKCGRRLKPRIFNCHHGWPDRPCWHYTLPPHKIKKWWKKRKVKNDN